MKLVVSSKSWTDEYLVFVAELLTRAGFYVDFDYGFMNDPEGDIAIYADESKDFIEQVTLFEKLRFFGVV